MAISSYRVEGPASIAFSGGRTSAYMLFHILEAYDGTLPPDVHVLFANTGKEMPQTLDFVELCSQEWDVKITWLEYAPEEEHKLKITGHNSASRNGEPFEAIIRERGYLPGPRQRYCSEILKQRTLRNYMHHVCGYTSWENVVGIRADEPMRAARIRARNEQKKERYEAILPLVEAGVTRQDVSAFWRQQPFDLALPNAGGVTPFGNCDLCFLKSYPKTMAILETHPGLADWWIKMEAESTAETRNGRRFRIDRPSYAEMKNFSGRQSRFDLGDEDLVECNCTD